MVNLKNKIGLFLSYLCSLNLAMFNLLTYLNKPTYLIGLMITYLPRHTRQHLISKKLDNLNLIN
jgi:hypothetical protein